MKFIKRILGLSDETPSTPPEPEPPKLKPLWRVTFFSEDDVECSYSVRAADPVGAVKEVRLLGVRGRSPVKDLRLVEVVNEYQRPASRVAVKFYVTDSKRGMLQTTVEGFDSAEGAIDAALELKPEARIVRLEWA